MAKICEETWAKVSDVNSIVIGHMITNHTTITTQYRGYCISNIAAAITVVECNLKPWIWFAMIVWTCRFMTEENTE